MTNARRALLLHGLTAFGGIACAMLLVGLFRGTPLPFSRQEVRYAWERFRTLFGESPAELVVVLADDPRQLREMNTASLQRQGATLLPFVTRAHLNAHAGEPGDGPSTELKPLAHEACHLYVAALANRVANAPADPRDSYGHRALPDWFDETAATLCESTEGRAARRRQFRASLHRRIPLREFERMPHPLSDAKLLERLAADRPPGQVWVQVSSSDEMKRLLPDTNAGVFYSQALSLGEFLAERGGPGALRGLVRPLAEGKTLDQALAEARRDAPGLPATVEALEAEWIRWVERQDGA